MKGGEGRVAAVPAAANGRDCGRPGARERRGTMAAAHGRAGAGLPSQASRRGPQKKGCGLGVSRGSGARCKGGGSGAGDRERAVTGPQPLLPGEPLSLASVRPAFSTERSARLGRLLSGAARRRRLLSLSAVRDATRKAARALPPPAAGARTRVVSAPPRPADRKRATARSFFRSA